MCQSAGLDSPLLSRLNQSDNFSYVPNVIDKHRYHRRGNTQRFVDATKVLVQGTEDNRVLMIL